MFSFKVTSKETKTRNDFLTVPVVASIRNYVKNNLHIRDDPDETAKYIAACSDGIRIDDGYIRTYVVYHHVHPIFQRAFPRVMAFMHGRSELGDEPLCWCFLSDDDTVAIDWSK